MTTETNSNPTYHRALCDIAADIRRAWPKPYFGAVPYLEALGSLDNVSEKYGYDSGRSIVLYFLANAATFRGPTAKALKAELKRIAGVK